MNVSINFLSDIVANRKLKELCIIHANSTRSIYTDIVKILQETSGVATIREIRIRLSKDIPEILSALEILENRNIVYLIDKKQDDRAVARLTSELRNKNIDFNTI